MEHQLVFDPTQINDIANVRAYLMLIWNIEYCDKQAKQLQLNNQAYDNNDGETNYNNHNNNGNKKKSSFGAYDVSACSVDKLFREQIKKTET